jgi:hypothetical protein
LIDNKGKSAMENMKIVKQEMGITIYENTEDGTLSLYIDEMPSIENLQPIFKKMLVESYNNLVKIRKEEQK